MDKILPDIMDVYYQYQHLDIEDAIRAKLEKYHAPHCVLSKASPNSDEDIFAYFKKLEDIPLMKKELVFLYEKYTQKPLVKRNGKPYSNVLDRIIYLMGKHGVLCYGDKHKDKRKISNNKGPKPQRGGKTKVKKEPIAVKRAKENTLLQQKTLKKENKKLEDLKKEVEAQEARVKKYEDNVEVRKKRETVERVRAIDDSKPQAKPLVVDEEIKKALKDKKILFEPNPGPQTDFLASSCKDVLYGGQAGGGKSFALIVDPLRYATNKNHRALILRRTMPELRELIDKSREIYPRAFKGAKFKEVEKTWLFPSGAKIMFGYCEKDSDVYQFQGQAYSWIGYDELTHLATEFPWQYLASRLRTTDPELPTYMRATTNPGGPGHHWVKKRYIDPNIPHEAFIGEDGLERMFIPATLHDNPYIAKDGQYEAMLKSLPEVHRRRLLEGDWDVNEGAAFSEFSPKIHCVQPFEIPNSWQRLKGVDYGYAAESACIWGAVDPNDGTLIIYRELYEKGLTGDDLAARMSAYEEDEIHSITGVLDGAAWNKTGYVGPTIGETLVRAGHKLRPADKNRIAGKVQVHERLKIAESGRPKMIIFSTCVNLIRELSTIQYDKTKPEDVDTKMSDHAYDALRYLIMSRPRMQTRDELTFQFKQQAMLQDYSADGIFGY